MATWKKLLVPSTSSVLLILHLLCAFYGQRTSGDFVSRSLNARKDGKGSDLQVDFVASTVGSDGPTSLPAPSHGIRFDPTWLDFKDQSIGMPTLETVHIFNPSTTQPLHLNSISGDSPVFHASFFRSKVLKAGESTTFDVIFLARVLERVQTTLYIQTSLGTFNYKVQGVGVSNRFRLRSLLGARIPLNATYSPLISMYNPFNSSLQITEMYSSGGELHLELLTGQPHGIKSLWEIRPYETKAIGRANFFGRAATNHTSFIRIRTSHLSNPSIVLPVEVEVLEASSLFLSREILDFGILKSGESKSLPLYVLNTAAHQVHIKSITVVPENRAIEVEYTSIILKPGSKYTKIATITFHSDRVSLPHQTSGVFTIRADGRIPYQLEVPFEVSVLHGSLSYEKSKTLFKVGDPPFHPVVHQIPLANRFKVPVVLYDVKLPSKAQELFNVSSLSGPFILPPDSEWYYPFSVQFLPTSSDCLFNTSLRLYTNSTYFTIPLHCYDGRVKYSVESESDEEDVLDCGVLSETDVSSKMFTVHNLNPVEVQITSFTVSPGLPHTTVELLHLHSTNQSSTPHSPLPPPKPPYFIDVGHSASFRVNVTRPTSKGTFSGEVLVHTSFDKVLHVPVYYKTSMGGLKVSPHFVEFEPTFPYGVSKVPLYVTNLYHQPVTVSSVSMEPQDPRFTLEERAEHSHLKPKETAQIGTAVFDPLHEAGAETVYLGVVDNMAWHDTTPTVTSPSAASAKPSSKQGDPMSDLRQFSSLWKTWNSLIEEGANMLNFSYVVKSDFGSELNVPGRATLVWPQLLESPEGKLIEFPTTTIGSSHLQVVNVTNPSRQPLMIQPVLLQHYDNSKSIVDLLSEQPVPDLDVFDFSTVQSNSFTFLKEDAMFNTDSALTHVVIQPDDPYQISVSFSPKVDSVSSTLLLIRNNLTVLDYVVLKGLGVQGVFSIDGIQPSSEPLVFEFSQAMMERCYAGSLLEPMKLSRVFTMYNSGSTLLTLYLVGVGEGGREEGGFSVLNYHREIIIKPNKTKSIEITFTPDFTISRISNSLQFKTSTGTELLFPLLAILPHNLLAVCYAMQPRPEWEQTIAWISVPFWICVLVSMVAIVLAQTNFGYGPGISYQNDKALPVVQATGGQVFDLRNIKSVPPPDQEPGVTRKSRPLEALSAASESHIPSRPHLPASNGVGDPLHRVDTTPPPKHRATPTTSVSTENRIKQASVDQPLMSVKKPPSRSASGSAEHPETDIWQHSGPPELSKQPISTMEAVALVHSDLAPSPLSPVPVGISQLPPPPLSNSKQPTPEADPPDIKVAHSIVTHSTSNRSVSMQVESKLAKTEEPDRKVEIDVPSQVVGTENTSPTTGATFLPLNNSGKKLKGSGSRKSGSKLQKSGQASDANSSTTATLAPHSSAPVVMTQRLDREYLERKGSESSLKSTDSESTGSSVDKYDEKEDPGAITPPVTTKTCTAEKELATAPKPKPHPHKLSLAKEPNTGQTVHISESSPGAAEVTAGNEDDGKRDVGSNLRGSKSKRKLRQQRKEEKSKKKEKEKQSKAARDRVDKSHSVMDDSAEQLDEEVVDEAPVSMKLAKPPNSNQKTRQKGSTSKHVVEPIDPRSYTLEASIIPASPTNYADNGEGYTPPPAPPPQPPSKQASLSVPSSAIKSSRGVPPGKPQYEEGAPDPFSQNPDRSTYARKKANPKKSTEKAPRVTPEENSTTKQVRVESEEGKEALDGSDESVEDEGDSNTTSPEAGDEIASSTELDPMSGKLKGQPNPTSPHDLAASLLSKIPIKRSGKRSAAPGRAKSFEILEYDDDDMEIMKPEGLEMSDEVEKLTRPNSLSPIKDGSMMSPSPPLSGGEYNKPPSSLSLDAEPFYPSSQNFKSKKHSKAEHKSGSQKHDGRKRSGSDRKVQPADSKDAAELRMGHGAKSTLQHGRTPTMEGNTPDVGPMGKAMLDRAELYQLQQMEKAAATPSTFPYTDPQMAYRYNLMLDAQDHLGDFRRPMGRDPYYSDEAMLAAERARHDLSSIDPAYYMQKTGHPPPVPPFRSSQRISAALYQQQQQQKLQQHMPGYLQAPPGFGQEVQPSRMQQFEEDFKQQQFEDDFKRQQFLRRRKLIRDLYRQERAALAAVYAREQARKSAEALSSLHNPTRLSSGASLFSPQEPSKHTLTGGPPGNMWEDYLDHPPSSHPPSSHPPHLRGFDDASPGGGADAESHLLNRSYMLSNLVTPQAPSRGRSLSEASDIGGEILSNYQPPSLQSPTSAGPPGYQRAPGAEYSRVEQQQDHDSVGKESSPMLEHQQLKVDLLAWPPKAEDSSLFVDWEGRDTRMMDSPLPSTAPRDHLGSLGLSVDTNLAGVDQSPSSNTYALFENQSIWSLNNSGSESSNHLSWAMLGASEHERRQQKSPDL